MLLATLKFPVPPVILTSAAVTAAPKFAVPALIVIPVELIAVVGLKTEVPLQRLAEGMGVWTVFPTAAVARGR